MLRGSAAPPEKRTRKKERSTLFAIGVLQHSGKDGGDGGGDRGAAGGDEAAERFRLKVGAGHEEVAAGKPAGIGHAPGIGVEHGDDAERAVVDADADAPWRADGERVQINGAVAVDDALGIAGGSGGVAHGGGGALVEIGPGELRLLGGEEFFVVEKVIGQASARRRRR